MTSERFRSLLIYAVKCVAGALLVFAIASAIHYKDYGWSLISVLLVISPDAEGTVEVAMNRIKSNVIGASMGLLCLFIAPSSIWTMCLAVVLTLTLCYLVKLDTATRSALAAAIIVMLHQEGVHVWDTAIERVIAVLSGCVLGLLVTYVFHSAADKLRDQRGVGEGE